MAASRDLSTEVIRLYGVVQGVGFRPFVSRLADRLGVKGCVANKGAYVEIHAQAAAKKLAEFRTALEREAPPRSAILELAVEQVVERAYKKFQIIDSKNDTGAVFVSPDIAVCEGCKQELFDPDNRRYLHPFINCTACGPRLTILDAMPYDRERTSMHSFPMCPRCAAEYRDPATRRYDAQPVCCNDCGPEVYLIGRAERGREAITCVRRAIMAGKIVAVKGIGGFHLCCNAADEEAVRRLRVLKHRPMKPFAVMLRDLDAVHRKCVLPPEVIPMLDGYQKPVVLLEKKAQGFLAESVAPDNPSIGVMLPYAPLQLLLFRYDDGVEMTDALVMTSGNVSGAPICRCDEDAVKEISGFCDIMISNDRRIRLRADDSVMDFFEKKPYMIRRSRGFAPLPFRVPGNWRGEVLGIGGELKNTFCLGHDNLFYLSPYVGDVADVRTVDALRDSMSLMSSLLEIRPRIVACDLHPKYNTVAVAEAMSLPMVKVQHHYAHILSCMVENGFAGEVIGVAFDGTGFGTDGTIWGGEFLVASLEGFTRMGRVAPFLQTGGDAAAREGRRIAVSLILSLFPEAADELVARLRLASESEFKVQRTMAAQKLNSVESTSAGRLFDAVSAILGLRRCSTFEGEGAMALEFAARRGRAAVSGTSPDMEPGARWMTRTTSDFFTLRTDELIGQLILRRIAGEPEEVLAYEFHRSLAAMIAAGCHAIREQTGLETCALSGGVFQNRLLLELCADKLRRERFRVLLHGLTPPNDGGIALGQAAYAMYHLNHSDNPIVKEA